MCLKKLIIILLFINPREKNNYLLMSKEEKDSDKINKEIFEEIKLQETPSLKTKLISVYKISDERRQISEDKYMKEYDVLEEKFNKKYIDIYKKINDIASNQVQPEVSAEEMAQYKITDETATETKPIEGYWNKILINSHYFTIIDKDKEILKYLTNVSMEQVEGKKDFIVHFDFAKNDFFTNERLSKKYIFGKDDVKEAEPTEINWLSEDKNHTKEKKSIKLKKGKKAVHKTVTQDVDCFFSFFNKKTDLVFIQDEVTFFQEELFTNQLEYYLGLIDLTHFDKDDEIEEDEDDDDDDDDEEDNKKKGKKKVKKTKDAKVTGGKNEECKNQ